MMMELVVLGSGTCVPSKRRSPAGYLVRIENELLLFDSGSGSLGRIASAGIDFTKISRIFYTHLHLDHTSDLLAILFARKHAKNRAQDTPLKLYGPGGFSTYVNALTSIPEHSLQSEQALFTMQDLTADAISTENSVVSYLPMKHGRRSLGYRIETRDQHSLVYSGDTDVCPETIELARNCDALILECSHPDGHKVDGHLTPSLAGQIATEAGCKRLVLTHFYPICDGVDIKAQCTRHFSGEIILAEDMMRISIGE